MEEKKNYSIIGQVTIGTDEYRDLIEGKLSAEKEASEYRSRCWKKESEVTEKEKEIERLTKCVNGFKDFLEEHSSVKDDYTLFISKRVTINE